MAGRRRLRALSVMLSVALLAVATVAACDEGTADGGPIALIGRDFEDPDVADLARRLCNGFPNDNAGNIKCLGQGFELNLLSDLSVGSVTLFNQESNGFNRYRGPMPAGLTWSDAYPAVLGKLGEPDAQYGGNGVDVYLLYGQLEGHNVEVHFYALHNNPEDLADSLIHYIRVAG